MITSVTLLFILACAAIYYIKISKKPLQNFGLTIKNWKSDILETIWVTLLIMLLLLFIKLGLITLFPKFHTESLFNPSASLTPAHRSTTSASLLSFFIVLYAVFAFVQEFIARGLVQSQLQEMLTGKHRTLNTILIANLLFAIMHIQISLLFVIVVFIFGLYWGWLYNRQQTLVGVSFSHILIGVFGNYLLNFNFIVK
jgi:membrane protease YdiL (CAAX protease family)